MGMFSKQAETEQAKTVSSATELMQEFDKFALAKKTPEEQLAEIEQNRPKSGRTTQLYRRAKMNLDITLTLIFSLCASTAACSLTIIFLRFSAIVLSIFSLLAALAALASYLSFIWYLHAPVGLIRKQYIQAGGRDEKQLDTTGRTIPGK